MDISDFIQLNNQLRIDFKEKWNRVMPFQDALFDRWERAKFLGFGDKTSIYESSQVFGDVKIGCNTWIGPLTILEGSAGIEIGNNCSISAGVQIWTHDSVKWALSGGRAVYDKMPVKIGSNCYIGPNSVISKGVTVGDYCVICAFSLVSKDVADLTIVAGVPATPIGKVLIDGDEIKLEYFSKK
jgi:acetyltransferase-like isoleucine patch superfamily enzyme